MWNGKVESKRDAVLRAMESYRDAERMNDPDAEYLRDDVEAAREELIEAFMETEGIDRYEAEDWADGMVDEASRIYDGWNI